MASIAATLREVDTSSFTNEDDRKKVIGEAHALISRIETPFETTFRTVLTNTATIVTLKIAIETAFFGKWLEKNDGIPTSTDELNALVPLSPVLFGRLVRHLAAVNILWTKPQDLYEMSPFAKGLIKEDLSSGIEFIFELCMPSALRLPDFVRKINYQNPESDKENCFQYTLGKPVFEYMKENPTYEANFGRWMKSSAPGRGHFASMYPCEDLKCDPSEALIVDIGGSTGHELQVFKTLYPHATGRLVVQDLPDVIKHARTLNPTSSVELQEHDFFTPEPIQGANLYLLHGILHDWPDIDAKRILENLRPALKAGHSKLLIHEVVVSDVNPDAGATSRDWVMMLLLSGAERTENQWRDLITSAGYKVNKIWTSSTFAEWVIETEVA